METTLFGKFPNPYKWGIVYFRIKTMLGAGSESQCQKSKSTTMSNYPSVQKSESWGQTLCSAGPEIIGVKVCRRQTDRQTERQIL